MKHAKLALGALLIVGIAGCGSSGNGSNSGSGGTSQDAAAGAAGSGGMGAGGQDASAGGSAGQAGSGAGGQDASADGSAGQAGSSSGGTAGLGGSGGSAGQAGSSNGGNAGQAGSGGGEAGGLGGSGGQSDAGVTDAGSDAAADACTTSTWCLDSDNDQYGDPNVTKQSCVTPSSDAGTWTTLCTDCADNVKNANPGQTQYIGLPYASASGPSYDYDCNGTDDSTPNLKTVLAASKCNCANSKVDGYLPNTDPSTTSSNNPYCGSTRYQQCKFITQDGAASCEVTVGTVSTAFPCR